MQFLSNLDNVKRVKKQYYVTTLEGTKKINKILDRTSKYLKYYINPDHCCTREEKLKKILKVNSIS